MKVSIIIPFYNSENYLSRCIESAAGQTYSDIEIILINDGSTDGSEKVCMSYAQSDPRIRLITQDNKGVSVARNAGLDAATGDLISFIDSDDYVENDYIEYLAGLLEKSGSDMACCGHEDNKNTSEPRIITGSEECLKDYLTSKDIFASVWGKIYRRSLFDGIRFPEGKRFEDNFVLFRLIGRCSLVAVGYLPKYHYIIRPESFVSESFSSSQMDVIDAMLEQREFVAKEYPALLPHANALVVYAANRCLTKMADSNVCDEECINRVKPLYKEYGNDFLKGNSSSSAKRFYRMARISPTLAMRFYRLLSK